MILQPSACELFRFRPRADGEPTDVYAAWRRGDADALAGLRSRHIGYVLQHGGLLPYLTVRENIELSRRLLHLPLDAAGQRLAEKLRIAEQLDKRPAELSVGQRQRAAIARALAHEPPVVIADEPTAAIDPVNAAHIVRLLVDLADEMGVTLILATHAHDLAERLGFSRVEHEIETSDDTTMTVTVSHS